MPFRIGLSGLSAAQADLKVTGNNIANVGTIGFKQSRAEFADVYATSKFGSVSTAIGSGVRLAATAQQFTQGNIVFTENNLDMGITGDGFFTMDDVSGNRVYTRNGQFKLDRDGYIVDNSGSNLKGYGVDNTVNPPIINTGDVVDLQIISNNIPPNATTEGTIIANLDANAIDIPAATAIDPTDPTSYSHTTSFTTYDSLGNAMQTSMFFQKNDTATNAWTFGVRTIDSSGIAMPAAGTDDTAVVFSNTGLLTTLAGGQISLNYNPTGAAAQTIVLDIADITQYGANFGVTNITQNGYTTGQLSGLDVDQSGVISARFTNGESNLLGQIFLTNFTNNQGLSQLGDNYWGESFTSGPGIVNIPGNGNAGLISAWPVIFITIKYN